ncbi:MAG: hypothetical protein GXP63_05570 [DPANN group archaeon]|nr:hypothetical protein [DPANN group archaeon]
MVFIFVLLVIGIVFLTGCSSQTNSGNTQGRTYNAPQGQYGGGCGVTAPFEGTPVTVVPAEGEVF